MTNINYKNLEAIVVKSQEELDRIPLDFKGQIYIVLYNFKSALSLVLKKAYIKNDEELKNFITKYNDDIDVVLENKPINYKRNVEIIIG